MSETEIQQLFEKLKALTDEISEMKVAFKQVATNSELIYKEYQRHGSMLEGHTQTLDRIALRCPLLKPSTDEFEAVMAKLAEDCG